MNEHPATDLISVRAVAKPRQRAGVTVIELLVGFVAGAMLLALGAAFLLPSVRTVRPAARRSACKNNLKQIGLALHNYADMYGSFPPAYSVDADGKPLHSWRTLILPYMDQPALYDSIDFAKAWDDPANAEAFKKVIPTYFCPSADSPKTHTTYMAVVTPNSCIQTPQSKTFAEITDGTSNTIVVIEVDAEHGVPWMSPQDADESLVDAAGPDSALPHTGGMHALFADGRVQYLSAELPAAQRRAMITVDGGEPVEP